MLERGFLPEVENILGNRMSSTASLNPCHLAQGLMCSHVRSDWDGINTEINAHFLARTNRRQQSMTEHRLLKATEAAQILGVSILTIYGWTSSRKIPFRKVGRLLRFDQAELENWTRRDPANGKKGLDPQA